MAGFADKVIEALTGPVIGPAQEQLDNVFKPRYAIAPTLSVSPAIGAYLSQLYEFECQAFAPSDKDMAALDDFFDYYGYSIGKYDIPKLNVRKMTFVKTREAVVKCVNNSAAQQMAAMLNNGTHFWQGEIGEK